MGKPLRALIVEDSESDTLLVVRELKRAGYDVDFNRVDTNGAMDEALRAHLWDIVLSDHAMPQFSAPAALEILRKTDFDLPFIIISGSISAELAVALMKAGANDWISKDDLSRLVPAVERELRDAETRRRRREAEEGLSRSEQRMRSLFETMTEGVVLIAPDGQIVQANRAAEQILGLERSEIEARSYVAPEWSIVRPDGTPMPAEEMAGPRALQDRRPVRDVEMGIKRPDGALAWIKVSAAPLMDKSGELEGVVGTFTDITARKEAEEELRKSEQQFRSIVETTREWIWVIDTNARIIYSNPAIENILGYSPEELKGQCYLEFIWNADKRIEEDALRKYAAEKRGWTGWVSGWKHKNGTCRFLDSNAVPLLDPKGELTGYQGADRDVTDRMIAEEELRRRKKEAEDAAVKAQTYLDFIAHDLTNILSPVMMYSEMISTDPRSDPWVKGTALKVVKQIERAASFVRNTRRLSESDRSKGKRLEPVDLRTVFEEKEAEIRGIHPSKRFTFQHSLPSEVPINAMGKDYIRDIVLEILENAAKHGKSDDVRVDIQVHAVERLEGHGYWKVEIADHGPGIPDNLKKGLMAEIFDPSNRFTRGIASSLPFMALIAEHVGGRLRIEDRVPGDHTKGVKVVLLIRKAGRHEDAVVPAQDGPRDELPPQPTGNS